MLTSGEVSQMFAGQTQQFMGQTAFAQQIGIAPPPMYGGGGLHGGPTPYSFSPSGWASSGYGGGGRFAGGVMSGMGSAVSLAGAGLGVASMFGKMGALGAVVDPFSAFGAARGIGMGMAGSLGVAALPLAGAAAIGMGVNSMMHGAQMQAGVQSQLGQNFQFHNPNSRTGMGFNRQDAQMIGSQIHNLAMVPELLTSSQELMGLLPKLKQSGMMQGVTDAADFSRRFKEAVGTVREVSKILGTTMGEAAEFFSHSRSVGFLGKSQQLSNVVNAQFTSGVTGMNTGQVMQMQQYGANMASSMGARRGLGAAAVTNIAQQIGMMQREGRLREGLIEDITGQSGAEGVQAAAQQMAGLAANMFQSSAGQLLTAGMVKYDESGRAIGLDQDLVKQFRSGQLSMSDLKQRAQGLTSAQKISFKARAGDLGVAFAGQVGAQGIAQLLQQATGGKYGDEGLNLIMQKYGASSSQADMAMQMMGSFGSGQEMDTMMKVRGREAMIKEHTDPDAIIRKLKTKVKAATLGGLESAGQAIYTKLGEAYDEVIDDLVGRHIITLSEEGSKSLAMALGGGSKKELQEMFKSAMGAGGLAQAGKSSTWSLGRIISGANRVGLAFGTGGLSELTGAGGWLQGKQRNDLDSLFGGLLGGRTGADQERAARGLFGIGEGVDMAGMARSLASGSGLGGADVQTAAKVFQNLAERRSERGVVSFGEKSELEKAELMKSGFESSLLGGMESAGLVRNRRTREGYVKTGITSMEQVLSMSDAQMAQLEKANPGMAATVRALKAAKAANPNADATMTLLGASNKYMDSGFRVNLEGVGGSSGASFNSIVDAENIMKGANAAIDGMDLTNEAKHALKNNPQVRSIIENGLTNPEIASALKSANDIEAREKLKKLGVNASLETIAKAREYFGEINSKGEKGVKDVLGALSSFKAGQSAKDFVAMKSAFAEAATKLSEGAGGNKSVLAVATALKEFSGANAGNAMEKFSAAQASIKNLTAEISGATGDRRKELVSAAGDLGSMIESTINTASSLRGKSSVTQSELMKMFGISGKEAEDVLASAGVAPGAKGVALNEGLIRKIEQGVAGMKGAGALAPKGHTEVATKDEELLKTLKKLDKNLDLMTSVMAVSQNVITGKDADEAKKHIVASLNESAAANGQGQTKVP